MFDTWSISYSVNVNVIFKLFPCTSRLTHRRWLSPLKFAIEALEGTAAPEEFIPGLSYIPIRRSRFSRCFMFVSVFRIYSNFLPPKYFITALHLRSGVYMDLCIPFIIDNFVPLRCENYPRKVKQRHVPLLRLVSCMKRAKEKKNSRR
jgi:hypothetical protein